MNILVTGGTGTIGRMVCKILCNMGHSPVVLSRDPGKQLIYCPDMIHEVGDIEDRMFLDFIVKRYNVSGVIHTAANKYINVCEDRPSEAVKTNIIGSMNILGSLWNSGIERSVFVSSDKASNHDHVYGISKYLMEKLVLEYSSYLKSKINCVRFGNVFGSSGSVFPIWETLINQGKDIVLRFFGHNYPMRYALLPSQAAQFCVDVFFENRYENGSVLFKNMPLVSLRTMAQVMVEGTNSKIVEAPALSMETEDEKLMSDEERSRLVVYDNDVLEISKTLTSYKNRLPKVVMNWDETKEFVRAVRSEYNQWI